ncbi:rRNA-processing protein EBP2 [Phytophthora nicotianae]|uniref:rRNA-processing protein EBP2 n=1 Tax=Phytophthora nicotianae TaxID=4792 RepID=A0A0W8DUE7_PHYNI|nr:rRNA-processing protein EBP2 [Phytophthora nicotianae]
MSAFAFLPPVQEDLPHHVSPARTITWTPVDPANTRLRWTRSDAAAKASLAHPTEPSTKSTPFQPRHLADEDTVADSAASAPPTEVIVCSRDAHRAASCSECLAIVLYCPPRAQQVELKLAFACPDVAAQVQKATTPMDTPPSDLTATSAYHDMTIVVFTDKRATFSNPRSEEPPAASTKEMYARLLMLQTANATSVATAVLHGLRTDATVAANVVDDETFKHDVQDDARATRRSVLPSRLRIQRIQPRVYDFQPQKNKNVASRLFDYLKDATYLGHRAECKERRSQASATITERRWL